MGEEMSEPITIPKTSAKRQARRVPAERPRPDKHDAITRAASETFLAEGFDRASLDQIAQRAGVSKQTIYSHFADKQALFKAICSELTEKLTIPLRQERSQDGDLRTLLTRLGDDALAMMLHPAALDLHRLVISAAHRFPELGHAAFEAGAQRMITDLSALLVERSQAGEGFAKPLSDAQGRVLAEQFMGMLRGFHQSRGLLGIAPAPAPARRAYVRACVELLLRAG